MNKEQMTQEQRAQLIEKLRAEYNDLNGKIARLNAFLCDIDFVKKVPDPMEQELMSMQFRSMKGYLDNLRGRIMFQEVQQLREENARKQLDEWKKMKGHIIPVNLDEQHHCGQDAVNFEQLSDNLTDTYKDYCRGVLEQFLSREITWAKFVEKVALPFCHENVNEFVNVIKDNPHNCRPGREKCQVGDGSAAVNEAQVPNSIKSLVGMLVVDAFHDTHKCTGCEYQERCNAKKVELVGGYFLCLEELPNSIVTE